jgi:hypothetical protein
VAAAASALISRIVPQLGPVGELPTWMIPASFASRA